MSARVEWLDIVGDPEVWRSVGLVVADDGLVPLTGTSLRITPATAADDIGIAGWALSGVDAALDGADIDGLQTRVVGAASPMFGQHDVGASGLDHVVVMTCDLERTTGAIDSATGCGLKRMREVGEMRQGFHRLGRGGLIVEVVSLPELPEGPARFWGMVLNVDDLDMACARIGADRVSLPKDAVQPGRRIATISTAVGLGFPVALMTT
ncbi:MAG: hypothetical protein P8O03_04770 [Ilumatobacter sp.]|nr:hypothetical protein [Ilumatobacter sp.]MDG2039196.1 hypothetical protein [Ilumatobacter sp.]